MFLRPGRIGRTGSSHGRLPVATPTPTPTPSIGGLPLGAAGAAGSNAEGFILSAGDDFDSALDIMGPGARFGRYGTTRGIYLLLGSGQQARSSSGLGGVDVDPLWTGDHDSNRGLPIASMADIMTQTASKLRLAQRAVATGEAGHLPNGAPLLAAMVHTAFTCMGRAPLVMEWYEQRICGANTKVHQTGWAMQGLDPTVNDWEIDLEAASESAGTGDGRQIKFNGNSWNNGVKDGATSTSSSAAAVDWSTPHKFALKVLANGTVEWWMDDVLAKSFAAPSTKTLAKAYALVFSNHTYLAGAQAWPTDSVAYYDILWWRMWRPATGAHWTPKVANRVIQAAAGAAFSVVLDDQTTLWGGPVTELLEACTMEPNEPGGTTNGATYSPLPAGITYDAATRTLAGSLATPGRLNIGRYVNQAGDTVQPHRIAVEIGPKLAIGSFTFTNGQTVDWDVYVDCDVGILTPKTITVSGLPTGLSFNAATGKVTGAPTVNGTSAVIISCTNGVGQSAQVTRSVVVQAAAPSAPDYEAWNGPGWFDAGDTSSVQTSGSAVTGLLNKRSGGGDLTVGGSAGWSYVSSVQNGKPALRLARSIGSNTAVPRLSATVTSPLSQAFQGDDKPFVVIAVFTPTDANTGFVWSASHQIDATNVEQIAVVRRNATASSVRKSTLTATPNDVAFGGGNPSGVAKIIAVRQNGTTVDIWDTSTTKAVTAGAQNAPTVSANVIFRLGAAESNSATAGAFATTQGNTDYFEIIVEAARTDAEIQQAITDLAAKWGISLA